MKLLIIAGPYEADRIRRAAVLAGFEAVAVEPGESLSGWITATRPDVIILAPQIVSADPAVALAKVRAVPRGRVPLFLVGEAHDEERLHGLADGFFVRPVAPDELLSRARQAVGRVTPRTGDDAASGPNAAAAPGSDSPVAAPGGGAGSGAAAAAAVGAGAGGDSSRGAISSSAPADALASQPNGAEAGARERERAPTLRPLVAARPGGISAAPPATRAAMADPPLAEAVPKPGKTSERWPPAAGRPGVTASPRATVLPANLLETLSETIDADFDAELRDVVRAMAVERSTTARASTGTGGVSGAVAGAVADQPRVDSGHKTREIPLSVTAALGQVDALPADNSISSSPALSPGQLTPETPPTAPTPATPEGITAEAVRARHALAREGTYFQILGLTSDATAAQIASACQQLLAQLSPDAVPRAIAARWDAELAELRTVVAEAGRLLGHEGVRRHYRAHLGGTGAGASPSVSESPPS